MSDKAGARARLSWPWRALGAAVLGVLFARWGWIFFAPHATVAAVTPEHTTAASAQLFGVAVSAVAPAEAAALPNVKLLGVYTGAHGFALVTLDGKRQAGFALGEELAPGTRLVEISADAIMLEHAGARQRVELEGLASGLASAKAMAASAVGARRSKT
jgi:hypothetical protein